MDFLFLAILFILGAITSFDDLRIGKVKNKYIIYGALSGIICYCILAAKIIFFHAPVIFPVSIFLKNVAISCTVSFFIWYFGFWSAGDAKLFMLFSFLVPLHYYGDSYPIPNFPSFILLANAFSIVFLFIILEIFIKLVLQLFVFLKGISLIQLNFKASITYAVERINLLNVHKKDYAKIALGYLSIFMFMNIIRLIGFMKAQSRFSSLFGIICIIISFGFQKLTVLFKKKNVIIATTALNIVFLAIIVFEAKDIPRVIQGLFQNFTFFLLACTIFSILIQSFLNTREVKKIKKDDLRKGMLLSHESMIKICEIFKIKGVNEKFYPDGLTEEQAAYIKEIGLNEPGLSEISISKTFPLTPFIFIGVFLTILKKGVILDSAWCASFGQSILQRFIL
ncbi:MAG: hypothetical protein WDL87_05980 [Candidatus Omnitrophota bacterium]|jgi:hypothetical protein